MDAAADRAAVQQQREQPHEHQQHDKLARDADHIGARLLVALPLVVGRDLKAFGLLTRKDEPLSDIAQAFAAHLERHAKLQAAPAAATQRAERRKAPAHR
jgi:hypothetical protein